MRYIKSLLVILVFCGFQLHCSLPTIDDITPPVVLILYPYEGSVLSGNVTISIESNDEEQVEKVWYYLDGNIKEYADISNPKFQIDITPLIDEQTHIILAAAIDKSGNKGYSTPISVIFSKSEDIIPPTVQILNPLNGQLVQDTVQVVAIASDDRIVREVCFFVDGDSVLSDSIYPYNYFWPVVDLADSSNHTVFAKAYDGSNNWAISNSVTVTVYPSLDRIPPTAQLIYPIAGQVLNGKVEVKVDATDDKQLNRVEFSVDGNLEFTVKSDTAKSPFSFLWDTTPYQANSQHTLFFKAIDMAGNQSVNIPVTFTVGSGDLVPPTAQLIYPVAGQILNGKVEVIVDANDNQQLDRIDFYVDGILEFTVKSDTAGSPFSFLWDTTPYQANSQHTLFFKAIDMAGNQSVNTPVTFTVGSADLIPPSVILLYPLAGSIITGTVNVTVDVADNIGVTRVEFYVDGGNNGAPNFSKTTSPWIYSWNTTPWANGAVHTLFIKAYDAAGNIGIVGPVAYTVQ